jgi:hypothetical protein
MESAMNHSRPLSLVAVLLPLAACLSLAGCGENDDGDIGTDIVPVDLVISRIVAPTGAMPGETIRIELTLSNLGDEPSNAPVVVTVVLSADTVADGGDRVLATVNAPALGSGESVPLSVDLVLPDDVLPGVLFYLGAIADPDDAIEEAAESNNGRIDPVGFTVTGAVDLVGESLTAPAVACAGQPIEVEAGVRNLATVAVTDVVVTIHLSDDVQITLADPELGRFQVTRVDAGMLDIRQESVVIPRATPGGSYWVGLIVDPDGTIPETDETNNVAFDAAGITVALDVDEPNDELASASFLGGPGPAIFTRQPYLCPAGDRDFFSFEQSVGTPIEVELTGVPVDLVLTLLDVNGSVLATSDSPGLADESIVVPAGYTGVHHVRVEAADPAAADAGQTYTLDIRL